jgi:hypothetical protein
LEEGVTVSSPFQNEAGDVSFHWVSPRVWRCGITPWIEHDENWISEVIVIAGCGRLPVRLLSTHQHNQRERNKMKKNTNSARQDKPVHPDVKQDQEIIALCAYYIWEQEGRPEGKHEAHWRQAEAQMRDKYAARV